MKPDDLFEHPDSFGLRLRDGLKGIAQADPISAPGPFDPDLIPMAFDHPQPNRRPARAYQRVGAVVAVVATVGGLAVIGTRDTSTRTAVQPTRQPNVDSPSTTLVAAEPSERTAALPDGALILDQLPAELTDAHGYTYVGGTASVAEQTLPANAWVQRWYTAVSDRPELQPHLKVASTSRLQQYPPELPPRAADADKVSVQGDAAWLYDDPFRNGRVVAFAIQELAVALTGYQLSDDELLGAAEHTRLAEGNLGVVVDAGALPAGLVERAVGTNDEGGFSPIGTYESASVRWYNSRADGGLPADGEPMLWLGWGPEDPDLFPLNRLEYEAVTDTTVHGVPAFVATSPGYVGVLWSENGYTYGLGGQGLDEDTVVAAANNLRPATAAGWNALEIESGSAAAPD